jgi:phage terminase large subunit
LIGSRAVAVLEALPYAAALIKLERERDDLQPKVTPTFRGAALEAQSTTEHEWILSGPSETGKTVADLWRFDSLLRATPFARAVILRKVRADMNGTVLETWRRIIAIRGGVSVYGGEEAKLYTYQNGARVFVAGMDRPGAALSSERDFIYVNQVEELGVEDWEYLSTRVTGRGTVTSTPMIFGDCNPGPPKHWIRTRPSLRVLESRHEDNPTLYTDDGQITPQGVRTISVLDKLTGVRFQRLRLGKWVAAEGVVYERFDRAVHVIPRFEIPASWRRLRVVDFGFTNPFVCQWWAIDGDGRAFRYREIYKTQRIVEDHARDIVRLSKGEQIEETIADHDAEDRATLERHGVSTIAAEKEITPGIQEVQARLSAAGDGKPRIFFLEDSLVERDEELAAAHRPVCTEDEFEVYAWPKDAAGASLKEVPVKQNDHGMDAARYLARHLDSSPQVDWHQIDPARDMGLAFAAADAGGL